MKYAAKAISSTANALLRNSARVGLLLGPAGAPDMAAEAQSIFDRLGVVQVPDVPLPSADPHRLDVAELPDAVV